MDLATSDELSVPKDALTDIETAGVLGESYLSIDVSQASGAPIENYGYLKSKPTKPPPSVEDLIRALNVVTVETSKAVEKMSNGATGAHPRDAKP